MRSNVFTVLWSTLFIFYSSFPLYSQFTTGNEKLQAFALQQEHLKQSPYHTLHWRLVGPDNRSGRATDVAGIPGNPQIMYVAFATGGVWKTIDGGHTWSALFDREATLSIGALGLAPSDNRIIYVGTGEANIFRASLPGMGMYKSSDGGTTFRHIGLENTGTIARIVVHPVDPNTLYVAASGNEWSSNADRGVYKSMDGGDTWQRVLFESALSGCIDLVMDPSDPNTLYASMWSRVRRRWSDPVPEDGDHLYKTTDGGTTWKVIGEGLPDTKVTGRIGLAIAPSNPNILYAFVDDHSKKREPQKGETDSYERRVLKVVIGGVIYRSNDKGGHWEKMGEVHDFIKPFSGTYGWVFSQIRVHPVHANEVYALGVSMARSVDGGKLWNSFQPTHRSSEGIHGDNHALWFDPLNPERIILGNDGGVSTTFDGGKKWNNFFDKLPTTQFYTVTYDMDQPFNIFGSVQDEGTMTGSSSNTFGVQQDSSLRSWIMAPGGEGTQIQVDPVDKQIVYASSYYGRLMKSDLSNPKKVETTRFTQFDVGRIDSLRGEWLAGTLLSRFDRKVLYHGLQHVYKTADGGMHWKRISPDLSYNDPSRMGTYPYLIYHQAITTIAEGDRPGQVYAGTDDGRIWYTPDDGINWTELTPGLPAHKHVIKIVPSRHMPGRVYVALNDRREDNHTVYLYCSDDQGKHWRSIAGDLPPSPANVIAEHPDLADVLFCGTDMGIYLSNNRGKSWHCLNANLPAAVSVNDLYIHPRDKKLVLGTYGRGVYILDDISTLR